MIFIDTNVAILLRDVHMPTHGRIAELLEPPVISIMTRIELENGVNRDIDSPTTRRELLDRLLQTTTVHMFNQADVLAYGQIIYDIGYDRRLTIDRLIAAQAMTRDARFITMNGKDFRRITGLKLDVWDAPPS